MKLNFKIPELDGWAVFPDIAGRNNEFVKLKSSFSRVLALGDLIDRGEFSHKVLEYFINNPNSLAIKGNHEWMFQMFFLSETVEGFEDWLWVGGDSTVIGFTPDSDKNRVRSVINDFASEHAELMSTSTCSKVEHDSFFNRLNDFRNQIKKNISNEYFDYLKQMPVFYETENCYFSHAPIHRAMNQNIAEQVKQGQISGNYEKFLENRTRPIPRDKIQFFGHLNLFKPKLYLRADTSIYAMCLDASKGKKLAMFNGSLNQIVCEDYV